MYNASLNIAFNHFDNLLEQKSVSETKLRDLVQHYKYTEEQDGDFLWKQFRYEEKYTGWPIFPGKPLLHNRIARGAVFSFARDINSAISNKRAGNIKNFTMHYKSKKRDSNYVTMFEDCNFPKELLKLPSTYCFTTRENGYNKRTSISFKDIFKQDSKPSGFNLEYDRLTNKHYILYTVPISWYPSSDRRNDNQVTEPKTGEPRILSCDPGVRTFITGYDPSGKIITIGKDANKELFSILQHIDDIRDTSTLDVILLANKKLRNLVTDLHWKAAKYMASTYDLIILPHFRTAELLRGKKLSKRTKRELQAFSFYQFKLRLKHQCLKYGSKLLLVEEDYTSKTCGYCGGINQTLGGSKVFHCNFCNTIIDRDENGARNIMLKNLSSITA